MALFNLYFLVDELIIHFLQFPPFATNTIGHFVSIGRREVGHGILLIFTDTFRSLIWIY